MYTSRNSALIEQPAIQLCPQAGKSLVIPRRRESSKTKIPQSGQCLGMVSLHEDFSINWIPACAGMTKQRGISLIELIMFIVIVSVALAGILLVMNVTEKGSADPLVRKQTLAAAESLLEEIELQDFINSSTGVATCPSGTNPVTQANRAAQYHIVCDFNNFASTGIFPVSGAVATLPNYNANVVITNTALGSIAAGSAVLINVTVTPPNGMVITATGYRAAY